MELEIEEIVNLSGETFRVSGRHNESLEVERHARADEIPNVKQAGITTSHSTTTLSIKGATLKIRDTHAAAPAADIGEIARTITQIMAACGAKSAVVDTWIIDALAQAGAARHAPYAGCDVPAVRTCIKACFAVWSVKLADDDHADNDSFVAASVRRVAPATPK